jgi:hypothetical protein
MSHLARAALPTGYAHPLHMPVAWFGAPLYIPHKRSRWLMALHIVKLCVGADSIEDLAAWQKGRVAAQKAAGLKPRVFHTTFQMPKRQDEVLDGHCSGASGDYRL